MENSKEKDKYSGSWWNRTRMSFEVYGSAWILIAVLLLALALFLIFS